MRLVFLVFCKSFLERWKDSMGNRLMVNNVPPQVGDAELHELFSGFGKVVSALVPLDRDTRQPRGFAFVEMSTPEEAKAAIVGMHGKEILGQLIRVEIALERQERTTPRPESSAGAGGFRSGFGGGFGGTRPPSRGPGGPGGGPGRGPGGFGSGPRRNPGDSGGPSRGGLGGGGRQSQGPGGARGR
ncbi:MAG: RNA-binding protein [Planctomycetota bacterium]|nr:MAG: RNA-binding protein [Planctomycetota bacterium]